MLSALLMPMDTLSKLQDECNFTKLMAIQEELKTYPLGDVWNYYMFQNNLPMNFEWFKEIEKYETEILTKRG